MRKEILLRTPQRVVVRGHLSEREVRQITGCASGIVRHLYWRHAFTQYRQPLLFEVPRSRYVEARGKGRGAFPVTVLDVRGRE